MGRSMDECVDGAVIFYLTSERLFLYRCTSEQNTPRHIQSINPIVFLPRYCLSGMILILAGHYGLALYRTWNYLLSCYYFVILSHIQHSPVYGPSPCVSISGVSPSPVYPFLVCIHLSYPFFECISTLYVSVSPVCIPSPCMLVSVNCILLLFVLIIEESQPNLNLSYDDNEKVKSPYQYV